MKLRDELNSVENYTKLLSKKKGYITEKEHKIMELYDAESKGIQLFPKTNVEVIQSTKDTILIYQYDIIMLLYSVGEDISVIRTQYLETIKSMQNVWRQTNGYVQMVMMLSIGVMLDIEQNEFNKLMELVKNDNPNDFLIDFLIKSRVENWEQHEGFKFSKPYKTTKEIVEITNTDKNKGVEKLVKYMQKDWYKSIETKTHTSKFNIHSGYWCFESGALVKILGLDDSILKNQEYYPYDLVHY